MQCQVGRCLRSGSREGEDGQSCPAEADAHGMQGDINHSHMKENVFTHNGHIICSNSI